MSSMRNLTPINTPPVDSNDDQTFRVSASPGTDLWRKPPSADTYNAPCWVANYDAKDFRKARVTVSADWTRQYDQGGLVLFLPAWPRRDQWVKTGIEFYEGKPHVSVVAATQSAADWSLLPTQGGTVTLEIEREEIDAKKGTGSSLWVYMVENGKRTAIREVTWVFGREADLSGKISVGIYAARPTEKGNNDTEKLVVEYRDLSLH